MADETKANEAEEGSGGGLVSTLIAAAIVLVLAGGGGFFTYRLVIAPRLATETSAEPRDVENMIPAMPATVEFPQKFVNIMRVGNEPASTLVFQVTLECNDQMTADLINMHRVRFEDMIIKLHDSRTRDELDDVLALKTSIQRQAKQKANDLLKRLGAEPEKGIYVTDVFHNLFMVQDQS